MLYKNVDRDSSPPKATGGCTFLLKARNLQNKFEVIIKEAKLKLFDATIEALQIEEQQTNEWHTERLGVVQRDLEKIIQIK